jgi:hypothetical protein
MSEALKAVMDYFFGELPTAYALLRGGGFVPLTRSREYESFSVKTE